MRATDVFRDRRQQFVALAFVFNFADVMLRWYLRLDRLGNQCLLLDPNDTSGQQSCNVPVSRFAVDRFNVADPKATSFLSCDGQLIRVLKGGNESTAKTQNPFWCVEFVPNYQMQVLRSSSV